MERHLDTIIVSLPKQMRKYVIDFCSKMENKGTTIHAVLNYLSRLDPWRQID